MAKQPKTGGFTAKKSLPNPALDNPKQESQKPADQGKKEK